MNKQKRINIPPDVLAKCDNPDQFGTFDEAFSRIAQGMKKPKPTVKTKPRGRPKKK